MVDRKPDARQDHPRCCRLRRSTRGCDTTRTAHRAVTVWPAASATVAGGRTPGNIWMILPSVGFLSTIRPRLSSSGSLELAGRVPGSSSSSPYAIDGWRRGAATMSGGSRYDQHLSPSTDRRVRDLLTGSVTRIGAVALVMSSAFASRWVGPKFLSASNLTIIGTCGGPMRWRPFAGFDRLPAWSTFRSLRCSAEFDVERGADEHGMAARGRAAVDVIVVC